VLLGHMITFFKKYYVCLEQFLPNYSHIIRCNFHRENQKISICSFSLEIFTAIFVMLNKKMWMNIVFNELILVTFDLNVKLFIFKYNYLYKNELNIKLHCKNNVQTRKLQITGSSCNQFLLQK
jgi:hypothetical protein